MLPACLAARSQASAWRATPPRSFAASAPILPPPRRTHPRESPKRPPKALPGAQSTDASLAVTCLPAGSALQNAGFESNTANGTVGSAPDCWTVPSTNADAAVVVHAEDKTTFPTYADMDNTSVKPYFDKG